MITGVGFGFINNLLPLKTSGKNPTIICNIFVNLQWNMLLKLKLKQWIKQIKIEATKLKHTHLPKIIYNQKKLFKSLKDKGSYYRERNNKYKF